MRETFPLVRSLVDSEWRWDRHWVSVNPPKEQRIRSQRPWTSSWITWVHSPDDRRLLLCSTPELPCSTPELPALPELDESILTPFESWLRFDSGRPRPPGVREPLTHSKPARPHVWRVRGWHYYRDTPRLSRGESGRETRGQTTQVWDTPWVFLGPSPAVVKGNRRE